MSLIARLATAAILLAGVMPYVSAGGPTKTSSSDCSNNEFWFETKSCCLPSGGPTHTPTPPKGNDCPTNGYYWHDEQACCVPRHPNPPSPSCSSGWGWLIEENCCKTSTSTVATPTPTPSSKGHHYKRTQKKSRTLCPAGLDACPISGLTSSSDYECLDTTVELESCGGCASTGKGQDCTAIQGAWNVACEQGSCAVYTCSAGYKRATDGKSCIAL